MESDGIKKRKINKIIYFAHWDDLNSGVGIKLLSQVNSLANKNVKTQLILCSNKSDQYVGTDVVKIIKIKKNRIVFLDQLIRHYYVNKVLKKIILNLDKDDVIYIRVLPPTPFYLSSMNKKRKCKIVSEHQSIRLDEVRLESKLNAYIVCDILFEHKILAKTDAIVGVTDEITQYELRCAGVPQKPHLTTGNGFPVKSVPVRQIPNYNSNKEFHLLCVATVSRWHGLDRLLQGLVAYDCTQKVILHIAGDGLELPHLQKLTDELSLTDRVVFHGFLTGKALDDLFDQCHIAIGSLGIHRKGLTQTSELKAREYCARGIPYFIAVSDPDFPADYPYILHLPADESPIDIEKVLEFAKEVCADPDHPQKMRYYAEEHLDWSVKMEKLKDFLEGVINEETDKNWVVRH